MQGQQGVSGLWSGEIIGAQSSKYTSSGPSPLFKMKLTSALYISFIEGCKWMSEWLEFFYSLKAYYVLSTCAPILSALKQSYEVGTTYMEAEAQRT